MVEATTSSSHATSGRRPRIFISAVEPSADRHAATLIEQLRAMCGDIEIFGVAGPRMQAAGCTVIEDWTSEAAMLLSAVKLAQRAMRLQRDVEEQLRRDPADLAIVLDSPALHLSMARRIQRTGCPVLYYIAPQLWAWAPWRVRRLRRHVNRLAAILPFEEDYFRQRGVDATYVGHPLVEQLRTITPDPRQVESLTSDGAPVVACLPGSRRHVIREVLPGQIEVARSIARRHPEALFAFAAAGDEAAETIRSKLADAPFNWRVETDANPVILTAADLALVASGTATLEVAYYRVPMIVMYNGSKWGYRLVGRWLIRTSHLSLVNILAGREIVPEFMPYYTSTAPIAEQALDLLDNPTRGEQVHSDLDAVITSLGTHSASQGAAKIALEMIGAPPAR